MTFRYLLCCCLLVTWGPTRSAEAQSAGSFAPLSGLAADDALRLYYSLDYIDREKESFDELIVRKSGRIHKMLGSASDLPKPSGVAMAEFTTSQRAQFSAMYRKRSNLSRDIVKSAAVLKSRSEKEAKQFAVFLYDLAVTMDPLDVEAAYERECLLVKEDVILPSFESSKTVYRFAVKGGGGKDVAEASVNGMKRGQALIKGLLVQELRGSQFLGEASQMNATVIRKGSADKEMTVTFNQRVGSSMSGAVDDMMTFHRKRQEKLPTGISVEISFEEQYIPKDGPSAGVASALLLESLFVGHNYDMGFAVTGAMNGQGKVGAVGGVDGKIRGAIARNCSIVAIPLHNEATIRDLLILEGPSSLAKIQVIGITVFEDALKLAIEDPERDAKTRSALAAFSEVQKLLTQRGGMGYLANPKVQSKLRSVVQAIPTHFSAKYLLLKGMGRNPTSLSLIGSVQAIDRNAAPLIRSLENSDFDEDKLGKDNFGKTIGNLNRVRPQLDSRCRPCADAIVDYAGYIRKAINSWPNSRRAQQELIGNIKRSGTKVGIEYDNLFDREDVKKELLQD